MKKVSVAVLFLTLIAVLQGCAINTNASSCDTKPEDIKIGMVTDSGGINDKSFNQGTWEGIEEYCAQSGIGATYSESTTESDYMPNLENMTNQENVEVVVAVGATLSNAVYNVASDNPDTDYILIDGATQDNDGKEVVLDNVKSVSFKEQEGSYLAGYIAGKMTETNKLGFIGGTEIPPVQRFGWGFVQGVADSNPDAEVSYQYSGTFSDAQKGQQIADAMYSDGVDIIFTAAGGVNDGVINSARAQRNDGNNDWVIGVDRDLYDEGKLGDDTSVVLTSVLKNTGEVVQDVLGEKFDDDSFKGENITLGYSDGAVGLPEENPSLEGNEDVITDAQNSLKNANVANNQADTEKAIGDLKIDGDL